MLHFGNNLVISKWGKDISIREDVISMSTPASNGAAQWTIDAGHSHVEFSIRHLMITTVKGHFSKVEGTIKGNLDDMSAAQVEATIFTDSIDTRDEKRDEHLRSADFFEVEKFPNITFRSTNMTKTGDNTYDVTGDLTIRDKTQPVTLKTEFTGNVTDPWGNEKAGFTATGKINRKDFGLTWNAPLEAGGVLVGEDVNISIEVQATKTA